MSKVQWRPGTLLSPVPAALVSCGTLENPNALTIGWTGIINSDPAKTYISVRPSRFSHDIIEKSREFVINLTTVELTRAADLCGVKSGKDTDKFALCGINAEKSFIVSAPSIAESPVSLECKVTDIMRLGSHDMFIADIVAVSVDDKYINESGKLRLDKAELIAYSHGEYFALGKKLGSFGYTVRKKSTKKRR
ncbi:MAG: flavin reductase family protein [Eubacteriales bacterium]|nr:flavin reductase family protein [Eubacteriales bacterium]